jgi:hypothetical protein
MLSLIALVASSYAVTPEANKVYANIGIAQNQIDPDAVERLLGEVDAIRQNNNARGELTMEEILSFLPLTGDERTNVVNAHPGAVPVNCSGDICTAVSNGQAVYQNLSQLNNIPAYFAPQVTLKVRWRGPSVLEICSIKGFQVKQLFWVNVDGAYIDARGADGSSFVDVSLGGSYPDC